jgi:peptidoglycan/LPS O-acetylase OafA/YrhL
MEKLNSKTYFHNLDATRFLGFLHVFTAHAIFSTNPVIQDSSMFQFFQYNIRAGFLGLDYFFVLSSFLLTWLILEERKITGQFKAIYFLIRRALRLWPLYFLIVFSVYGIQLLPGNSLLNPLHLPPIEVFLLFHANYFFITNGQDFLYLLVFLWVISVEEQFYVFWAFAMKFLSPFFYSICGMLIGFSVGFRYLFSADELNLWFNTLSFLGNFALGALGAKLCFDHPKFVSAVQKMSKWTIAAVYLFFSIVLYYYFDWATDAVGIAVEKLVFSFLFVFLIVEQCFAHHSLFKLGKYKALNYLGRISLGLYCYHGVVITMYKKWIELQGFDQTVFQVFVLNPLLILIFTLGIAIASYELFEKHVYRLRTRFY